MEDRLLWFGLVWLWCGDESFALELDVEASWNMRGWVGHYALRELMMTSSYIFQVVVVTRIAKGVEFL